MRKNFRFILGFLLVALSIWVVIAVLVPAYRIVSFQFVRPQGTSVFEWTQSDEVSKHLLHALVSSEDVRFYEHSGIDWLEVSDSLALNWRRGRIVRGGSTITQQVVKLAVLSSNRSLYRKIREAAIAVIIERFMTKTEILECYFNLVNFGNDVYGVGRASVHYFGVPPSLISVPQAIVLALALPSPNVRGRFLLERSLGADDQERYQRLARRMLRLGYLTEEQFDAALALGNFGRPIGESTRQR